MIGVYHDDPRATPAGELRSDAGVVVAEGVRIPEGLRERRVAAGDYLTALHVGPYEGLPDAWKRVTTEALPASGRSRRRGPGLEVYLNDPTHTAPADLRTEIRIPVSRDGDSTGDVFSVVPILNVTNLQATFDWFKVLGWRKGWDWGDPPGFGAVVSGDARIFLCVDGQGGRGRGTNVTTFGPGNTESADKGVWMSMFVEDVDAIHRRCMAAGLDVTWPPTDMEWGVREMHVRHPDGHVIRVSQGLDESEE